MAYKISLHDISKNIFLKFELLIRHYFLEGGEILPGKTSCLVPVCRLKAKWTDSRVKCCGVDIVCVRAEMAGISYRFPAKNGGKMPAWQNANSSLPVSRDTETPDLARCQGVLRGSKLDVWWRTPPPPPTQWALFACSEVLDLYRNYCTWTGAFRLKICM